MLAFVVTMPLSAFLVSGVRPADPLSFAGAALLLIAASVAAVWRPVIRAMGIEPSNALKLE